MGTFSSAIAIAVARNNVLINTGSGAFTPNQLVYQAPASRKTIFELAGAVAITVGGSASINFAFQKKSQFNGTFGTMFSFTGSKAGGGIGVYTPISFDDVAKKILAESGRVVDAFNLDTGSDGNVRLVMYPDEKILVTGGSASEGANFQFEYIIEQYFSGT